MYFWSNAMADYFTQFSCIFDVGSAENAALAATIRDELAAELDQEEGTELGFEFEADVQHGHGALWIRSEEYGEPDHVARFVLKCAERLNLSGVWGFTWGLSCSRPRLDGFGGGAQILDLGRRETLHWIDCSNWVIERMAADKEHHTEREPNAITASEGASGAAP
jgi:hypothetical protein